MEPKLSKSLLDANIYIEKNKIEKTVSEVLNKVVQSRNQRPLVTMIKILASMTPTEVLLEHGIKIRHNEI
jgi:pimeloyl-CoA synthetase